jgi:hypothetical protein
MTPSGAPYPPYNGVGFRRVDKRSASTSDLAAATLLAAATQI